MATRLPLDWARIDRKYSGFGANLIQPDVREDVLAIKTFAKTVFDDNVQMAEELAMARRTLLALCLLSPTGYVDIPHERIALINQTDVLRVTDEVVPNADGEGTMTVRRFRAGTTLVIAPGRAN